MNFSYYIAKRYLFSKNSNNAIHIISLIASFGVIVGSLALFIILSGFSGLRTFNYSLLEVSDPDIKIIAAKGKSFFYTDTTKKILKGDSEIKMFSTVIEERVFLSYKDKQDIAYIKGVASNYNQITKIDSTLNIGTWLDSNFKNTAVIGKGISYKLSLGGINFAEPLTISVPKSGKGFISPTNPFNKVQAQIIGVYTGSQEFENKFAFVSLVLARDLLKYKENQVTGIELKLNANVDANSVAKRLQKKLGVGYKVETKEQLNELLYKVINTENFISYLIFTLIVIIAMFTIVGTIIMMIIDKKEQLKTMLNLGATVKEIKKIFVLQGFLLACTGTLIGLIIGVILLYLQQYLSLFMLTENLAYPVEFRITNLLIVFLTTTIIGYIASKIASDRISKSFLES